jgi:8-oxo-dGTP pyrophosphatase MutT (NUDIX family)
MAKDYFDQAQTSSQQPVRAAGGLLWRKIKGSYEIAIIYRSRYNDWSLPKGKLHNGETWQQAALREVKEETGYTAQALGFAGAVSYTISTGVKVVCFWHMLPVGNPSDQLDDEVSQVVWLPVEAAHDKLQYPLEKALLEIWKAPDQF